MNLKITPFLKYVIITVVAASVVSYIFANRKSFLNSTPEAGRVFDYDPNETWIGPAVGERIDIARLKDAAGTRLSDAVDGLSMLVLVDAECAAGKAVSEQLTTIQTSVNKIGVEYYFVCVTSLTSATKFSQYTQSLSPQARSYVWADTETSPPQKLYTMVVPSHILIDTNGAIIRKWPGTSRDEDIRRIMSDQITADTLAELTARGLHANRP
jgi:hypothetical protein